VVKFVQPTCQTDTCGGQFRGRQRYLKLLIEKNPAGHSLRARIAETQALPCGWKPRSDRTLIGTLAFRRAARSEKYPKIMRKTPNHCSGVRHSSAHPNGVRLWTGWIQSWRAGDWEVSGNLKNLHFLEYRQPCIPRQPTTVQSIQFIHLDKPTTAPRLMARGCATNC
jgi:hypothetical protein